MGIGRVNALNAVAFTARADNLATAFQLASLALIAAYALDISCGFPERQRHGNIPSHLRVSSTFFGPKLFRRITRGFRAHCTSTDGYAKEK